MTDVRLTGLEKRYGDTVALGGIDLHVESGEFFTLVGPSGCGKTTTLRLIAGFEAPDGGSVEIGDESMAGVPPERRNVGVVFQNYALFPNMTAGENVAYGLRFSDPPGGATRRERVTELLELVDLAGMAERDPDTLSGGQRQRVALARALAPGPRLLLLDEPMSALDASLRERLRVQVREIQRELGITTVYVTHDQEEALAVSDRVAVVQAGSLAAVGRPREVYDHPDSRFAAEFLGDNNLFSGEVIEIEHDVDTDDSDGDGTERAVVVRVDDRTFRLAGEALRAGLPAVGDAVTVCVRPEDLSTAESRNAFPLSVATSEFLGAATRVHGHWGDREVTLRTSEPPAGDVAVGFPPEAPHVLPE